MKKSLVVLMAVVMTFAFAAATVAADLSYWAGGDMYFYFDSNERGLITSQGTFMVDGGLPMIKVTSGNTYAQMWLNQDRWRTSANQWRFAFGWNKIGDVLDLGFSTKDTGTANVGQVAFTDTFNNYHGDPLFNSFDNPYAIYAVLTLGNVTIKGEYNVAPQNYSHSWSAFGDSMSPATYSNAHDNSFLSAVFKLDSGEVHFGYKNGSENDDAYMAILGGSFAIGEASLKVDLWKEGEGVYTKEWAAKGEGGGSANYANDLDDIGAATIGGFGVQANFGIDKFDATLFYLNPEPRRYENEIGIGANYRFDKLTIGAKYFQNYNEDEDDAWEAFGIYNVGAFDVKFGALDRGDDDDTSIILGFHAGLW